MAAPDFTLPDQNGVNHSLSDHLGRWVFLCFYTRDGLAACVKEICNLRDHTTDFERLGMTVFGISPDSGANHKKFAEKYLVSFPLLSDAHKKVAEKYRIAEEEIPQISFLVNVMGEIEKIYSHVKPATHANDVLADMMQMQKDDEGA